MHRLFRAELDDAKGVSEFVVAQNLDIRGFSDWSLTVDSAQTALYIKKIYAKLIDRFFSSASFLKPTGDGLLIVEAFEENDLQEIATRTVATAMTIVNEFASLCDDEPMINFPVPEHVGIGIARGTASRLESEDRALDYSGRVLNLASRLMDLARPRGVVIEGAFGMSLLPSATQGEFREEKVYLKGVAPSEPIAVYVWPDEVTIPELHLRPFDEEVWEHKPYTFTRAALERSDSPTFRMTLDPEPAPGVSVEAEVEHAAVTPGGRKAKNRMTLDSVPLSRGEVGGKKVARFNQHELAKALAARGVGPTWPIRVIVSYRVA